MITRKFTLLCLIVTLLGAFLMAGSVYAASGAPRIDPDNIPTVTEEQYLTPTENNPHHCLHNVPPGSGINQEAWDARFTSRFIYCMRNMLQSATVIIIEEVLDYALPIIGGTMILAMALFGARLSAGMFHNIRSETMGFLLRFCAVALLIYYAVDLVDFLYNAINEVLVVVANAAIATFPSPGGAPASLLNCHAIPLGNLEEWFAVFDRVDCLLQNILGYATSGAIATGITGIIGAALFTGKFGTAIMIAAMTMIFTTIMFIARAAFSILMAFGAISFLLITLPIIAPTLLFKATEQYVMDRWLKVTTATIFQPGMVVAFMFFATTIFDALLFTGTPTVWINPGNDDRQVIYLEPGQRPPSSEWVPAVSPLFNNIGVNKSADEATQAGQMDNVYHPVEKIPLLPLWELIGETGSSIWFQNFCGEHGEDRLSEPNAERQNWGAEMLTSFGTGLVRNQGNVIAAFGNVVGQAIHSQTDPEEATQSVFQNNTRIAGCKGGFANTLTDFLNRTTSTSANATDNPYGMSRIHKLDLHSIGMSAIPGVPDMSVQNFIMSQNLDENGIVTSYRFDPFPETIPASMAGDKIRLHEMRMRRFLTSLVALLIMAAVFMHYVNIIPQIASLVTGKSSLGNMPNPPAQVPNTMDSVFNSMKTNTSDSKGLFFGGNPADAAASSATGAGKGMIEGIINQMANIGRTRQ
jgi:hypothetical protein